MNEENKNSIKKMGKVLGPEYSRLELTSLNYANKKLDVFSSLLIVIAFSSIGLSIQLLKEDDLNTEVIRWGIIFLTISIVFGLTQLIIDNKFFLERSRKYGEVSAMFNLISTGEFDETIAQNATECLNNLGKLPETSNTYSLFTEVFLVFTGVLLILHQLLS